MNRALYASSLVLLLGAAAAISASAQEVGVAGSIFLQADGGSGGDDLGEASGPLADSLELGTAQSGASGSYGVDFGLIQPSASTQLVFPDCFDTPQSCPLGTSAAASGTWSDFVTIDPDDPGLIGQTAFPRIRIEVEGTGFAENADASFVASSSYFLSVVVNQTVENRSGFYVTTGSMGGDRFGEALFSGAIVLGQPFLLQVALETTALAMPESTNEPGTYAAEMDLSSTLRWLGIEAVQLNGGESVAFTTSSESGVDWELPVPEPGAAGSALAALAGLLVIGRSRTPGRRRSRRSKTSDDRSGSRSRRPRACIELLAAGERGFAVLHTMAAGIPLERAWQSLRLFSDEVLCPSRV